MFLRNLDSRSGLWNGIILILHRMHVHALDAEILTGPNEGNIKLAPSGVSIPFTLESTQLPVRLAYRMTVNKLQDQTFHKLDIYLPSLVLFQGTISQRHFCSNQPGTLRGTLTTRCASKDIVYSEVL